MFEQTFKNIDDILYKDAGADSELDYIGQSSWILFLRYLDELETNKADEAELMGETYTPILSPEFRWKNWAVPKVSSVVEPVETNTSTSSVSDESSTGSLSDHTSETEPVEKTVAEPVKKTVAEPVKKTVAEPVKKTVAEPVKKTVAEPVEAKIDRELALTGKDLVQFVDFKLFPYLAGFKNETNKVNSIEYKIGEIFSELKNKIQSGFNLRDILEKVDALPFGSSKDKHELSHLYETKIKNMGNAGRNGGQYYTPRPLIRAMIQVLDPQIGETVYDGAVGSAGFLCEAFEYMQKQQQTTNHLKTLQENTFYGVEKKNLAYVIGIMNMILHGIEAPNIVHKNTLSDSLADIQEKDRHHIILANPPFGGKERKEIQNTFPIKTGETAFLFLQHFIKKLKAGGRAAIVIKNTFLSNTDNASISLRKHLLESCNLHTVLDMPAGTFLGAGVKTVVLFFTKGEATRKIWYYQLNPGRKMGKTNPLNDKDLEEFVRLSETKPETENSWTISVAEPVEANTSTSSVFTSRKPSLSRLNSVSTSSTSDNKLLTEPVEVNLAETTYDLSVKNPNTPEAPPLRKPAEILKEMKTLDKETQTLLTTLNELI